MIPNRTVCSVLNEMRKCCKTSNFSYLLGLIEEVQSMANRMEAALWDQNEIKDLRKEIKKLDKRKKILEDEVDALEQRSNK